MTLYEVLEAYITLYNNLEIRVVDMVNGQKLNPKEALEALTSYAIADEGTNTLFLGLVEVICLRDAIEEPYSMDEIELVLNYFPHALWKEQSGDSGSIYSLREKFYFPILHVLNIADNWSYLTNQQHLGLFQGLTLAGPHVFKLEIMNVALN